MGWRRPRAGMVGKAESVGTDCGNRQTPRQAEAAASPFRPPLREISRLLSAPMRGLRRGRDQVADRLDGPACRSSEQPPHRGHVQPVEVVGPVRVFDDPQHPVPAPVVEDFGDFAEHEKPAVRLLPPQVGWRAEIRAKIGKMTVNPGKEVAHGPAHPEEMVGVGDHHQRPAALGQQGTEKQALLVGRGGRPGRGDQRGRVDAAGQQLMVDPTIGGEHPVGQALMPEFGGLVEPLAAAAEADDQLGPARVAGHGQPVTKTSETARRQGKDDQADGDSAEVFHSAHVGVVISIPRFCPCPHRPWLFFNRGWSRLPYVLHGEQDVRQKSQSALSLTCITWSVILRQSSVAAASILVGQG